MIGRGVRLTRVHVFDVISDRGFWVDSGRSRRIFVVLDRALNQGALEHIVNIRKGQILNLNGIIEAMPDRSEALRRWTIDEREADQLMKEPAYLHVNGVSVLAR